MIDMVAGFLAGFLLNWYAFVALVIFGILAETNDSHKWATFFGIVLLAISYFFFHIPLETMAWGLGAYLLTGFGWSIYRYKRYVDTKVKASMNADTKEKQRVIYNMKPSNMLDKLTAWVIVWPFSVIENFVGDIVDAIQHVISKWLHGIYKKIHSSAADKLGVSSDSGPY